MRAIIGSLLIAVALTSGALTSGAAAQVTGPAVPDQPSSPDAQQGDRSRSPVTRPDSLSEDLARTNGVIKPPATGNSSVKPPPNQGLARTPVIHPPGSPGDESEVKPK